MKRENVLGGLALLLGVAALGAGLSATVRGQQRTPAASAARRPAAEGPSGPSPIIYPPQRIALRMNHGHPAHRELRCVRCHDQAGRSERASDLLIPAESRCLPCHRDRISRTDPPSADRCGYCHLGFDASRPAFVRPSSFPTPRLRFSHRAHIRRSIRCRRCHERTGTDALATRQHLPTMRQCFECHGPPGLAESPGAPGTCPTCHLSNPDGRIRARYTDGNLNPPSWFFDMRHDHEWLVRHRWVGADRGRECASCHRESDCTDCHDGRVRPMRIHPGDYLTTHANVARRSANSCTSCHATSRFCTECHSRLGLSPMSAPEVRRASRFHPPADLWIRGPVLHGVEAQRSMSTCASCHAERDCVTCHGALGIGAGVSPHPPGFAQSCRGHLETNARACAACHGDLDGLRSRCR